LFQNVHFGNRKLWYGRLRIKIALYHGGEIRHVCLFGMNEKHDTRKTQTDLTGVLTDEGASPEALLTRPRTFEEE